MLIHPQRPHPGQRPQLLGDQWLPELPHRVHDRRPAHTEATSHSCDRHTVLADPLRSGPAPSAPPSAEYGSWSPTRTRRRSPAWGSAIPAWTTPTQLAGLPPADPAPWSGVVPSTVPGCRNPNNPPPTPWSLPASTTRRRPRSQPADGTRPNPEPQRPRSYRYQLSVASFPSRRSIPLSVVRHRPKPSIYTTHQQQLVPTPPRRAGKRGCLHSGTVVSRRSLTRG